MTLLVCTLIAVAAFGTCYALGWRQGDGRDEPSKPDHISGELMRLAQHHDCAGR
jgi:hypothetical protein